MKRFILFITILFIASCGTKKHINKDYKQEIQISNDSISIKSIDSTSIIDTSYCYQEEFEPIDSSKPMIVDKVNNKYQNVRFKTSKVKNGIQILNKKEMVLNQTKHTLNEKIDDKIVIDKKPQTRNMFNFWLIVIIIIVLVWLQRKYLDK